MVNTLSILIIFLYMISFSLNGGIMKYVIVYWSRYGNGKKVVTHLAEKLKSKGAETQMFTTDEADPTSMPAADYYIFSAPAEVFNVQRNMRKFMKKLDRKNLIYSLRNRKIYATTGDRILIDFNLSGYKMGEIGKTDRVIITSEIHGCEKIKEINVIRNGKTIYKEKYDKMDIDFKFEDKKVEKRNYYYYIKVVQKNGEIAWTSPIWVKVE